MAGPLRWGLRQGQMESHWARNRPAYRCRHCHTSTTRPDPDRPPNTYIREDHVSHLPALVIRLSAGMDGALPPSEAGGTLTPADAVAHVRTQQVSLTFDPAARTLTTDTPRGERITVS